MVRFETMECLIPKLKKKELVKIFNANETKNRLNDLNDFEIRRIIAMAADELFERGEELRAGNKGSCDVGTILGVVPTKKLINSLRSIIKNKKHFPGEIANDYVYQVSDIVMALINRGIHFATKKIATTN